VNPDWSRRVTRLKPHTTLTATVWQEGDDYVSLCPELGVSSCGKTPEEAVSMLKEAAELYLENAVALGVFREIEPAVRSPFRCSSPLEVALT